jgi:hypothetical protein
METEFAHPHGAGQRWHDDMRDRSSRLMRMANAGGVRWARGGFTKASRGGQGTGESQPAQRAQLA